MGLKNKKYVVYVISFVFITALVHVLTRVITKALFESDNIGKDYTNKEHEIIVIYIGSSSCKPSSHENIPVYLEELVKKFQIVSRDNNLGFRVIGVSIENSVREGVDYLNTIYDFDEISVGNAMSNVSIQRYVWDNFDHPYSGATPQVLILKRTYELQNMGESMAKISPIIESEKTIIRKVGILEIQELSLVDNLNFEL